MSHLVVLASLLVLSLPGRDAGIRGRVTDPDDLPVQGAVVRVTGPAGVRTAATDAAGRFEVAGLPPAHYVVLAERAGLQALPVNVIVADSPVEVALRLRPLAVEEVVVVSAAHVPRPAAEAAVSATVITADDLRARQVETMAGALRSVPGLTVSESGGRGAITSVFPRGGESDYTLVTVDGQRLNSFGGGFDVSLLPLVDVDRIEVVRGPQSALFGADAIGGVVQVFSREDAAIVRGLVEAGSDDTARAVAATAGTRGAWRWAAAGEHDRSDGLNGSTLASGDEVANDDWRLTVGAGGLAWQPAGGTAIKGDVRMLSQERGYPGPFGTNPIGAYPGIDRVSRGWNDQWSAAVAAEVPWGGTFANRARQHIAATYGDLDSRFESPFGPSTFESRRAALRTQSDVLLAPATGLSFGVEAGRERARSTYITGEQSDEVPVERLVVGYFGEVRHDVGNRAAIVAGVRVEQIRRGALEADPHAFLPRPPLPADTVVSVNPRVAVTVPLLRDGAGAALTRLRASAGTGIRAPDAFELAFTDNPGLKPERSLSLELGLTHTLLDGAASLDAATFFNRYDDLIIAVGRSIAGTSRYRTDNISNARAAGLELGGSWRPGRALSIRGAYTWLATEILAVDGADTTPPPFAVGDALIRRPRHQGSVDAVVVHRRATAFLSLRARGAVSDIEPTYGAFGGVFTTPGYAVVDTGASVAVAESVEIHGRIANLLGRQYEEALGFPALGRTVMLGVRLARRR